MNSFTNDFYLKKGIIFLNHGSFGATPKPVLQTSQFYQIEMEKQPVEFLGRRAGSLLENSRNILANYLKTSPQNIVYITNTTIGVNIIARSLELGAGDEVLATNQEYGALDRTWKFLSQKRGFQYINHPLKVPVKASGEVIECLASGITKNTRVLFISHISSPTAMIFPLKEMIQIAKENQIITVIDGAHAPGQLELDLDALGADFYVGNMHKWLCAPKGSAFLYASPSSAHRIEPLVVSWGWQSENPSGNQLVDFLEWQGTRDISPFLSVPSAIEYQEQHRWKEVRTRCHHLASLAYQRITELTTIPPLYPDSLDWFSQMVSLPLPNSVNTDELKDQLYDRYQIEIPIISWNNRKFIRISIQCYNDESDINALMNALTHLIPF